MVETSSQAETATSKGRGNLKQTWRLLWIVYGVFPIIAGVDKFTNVLAEWSEFLPETVVERLPVPPQLFMYFVGVIEIIAGVIVLWRTEDGAYLVATWLTAIAVSQIADGNYDTAVRDLWIAVGAVALAQLTAVNTAS